jgi:hypothetical protein
MRIRKRETAVAEPVIMGWKQVEVQEEEEEDQDQPNNIDGEGAPAGSRAAVCSSYYNSDVMQQQQQQQARGDQGSCKEHELGSPVQQTPQLHYLDLVSREMDSGMGVGTR